MSSLSSKKSDYRDLMSLITSLGSLPDPPLFELLEADQPVCNLLYSEEPLKSLIEACMTLYCTGSQSKILDPSIKSLIKICLVHFCNFCVFKDFEVEIRHKKLLPYLGECLRSIPCISDRLSRSLILAFLKINDKFLLKYIRDRDPDKSKQLHMCRYDKWLDDSKSQLLKFSLLLDDPSFSWLLLNRDTYRLQPHSYSAVHLDKTLVYCEKQLNNIDALKVIARAEQIDEAPTDYIELIICNLEGRYEQVYEIYDNLKLPSHLATREFLEAAYMLGRLDDHIDTIVCAHDSRLSNLYRLYNEAKIPSEHLSADKMEKLHDWLGTWSNVCEKSCNDDLTTIGDLGGLIGSIHLAYISSEKDVVRRSEITNFLKKFLEQEEFIRSVVQLDEVSDTWLCNNLILQILSEEDIIRWPEGYNQQTLFDDGKFCFRLYRGLDDFDMIKNGIISTKPQPIQDLIEQACLGALKFSLKCDNHHTANRIFEQLTDNVNTQAKSELLMLKYASSSNKECDNLWKYLLLGDKIQSNPMISEETKRKLATKILKELVKDHRVEQSICESILSSNFAGFSVRLQEVLRDIPSGYSVWPDLQWDKIDANIQCDMLVRARNSMNLLIKHDIEGIFRYETTLLELLVRVGSRKSQAIETAYRIFGHIRRNSNLLNDILNDELTSKFYERTSDVWRMLWPDLIHLVTLNDKISSQWSEQVKAWIYQLAEAHPENFIYQTCWQLIELRRQRCNSTCAEFDLDSGPVFLRRSKKISAERLEKNLNFWSGMRGLIRESKTSAIDWSLTFSQTETFLKDVRRISRLAAELLYDLSSRLLAGLDRIASVNKSDSDGASGEGLTFAALYQANKADLDTLLAYFDWFGVGSNQASIYDSWTRCNCEENFRSLESALSRLAERAALGEQKEDEAAREAELENLNRWLANLNLFLIERRTKFKGRLFMAEIGTKLSRFNRRVGELALLPVAQERPCERPIFIHKIEEQVSCMDTLQRPRKLTLLGSDGRRVAFCLKNEDDSELVSGLMRLFNSINEHLSSSGDKSRKLCRLRSYSITPLGSTISLSEWCDGETLGSLAKGWLSARAEHLPELVGGLSTLVGERVEAGCKWSEELRPSSGVKLFYRLLWRKIEEKGLAARFATMKPPSRANTREYRRLLADSGVYLEATRQMLQIWPQDLVLSRLWLEAASSRQLWLGTRKLVASCASSSYVGHLLGIGDRHPENILLDCSSAELIHIDLGSCFDAGSQFLVPERVPFRLTRNMQRAFGVLGVEGPFRAQLERVCSLLGERASETVLQTLNEQSVAHYISTSALTLTRLGAHAGAPSAAELAERVCETLKQRLGPIDASSLIEQSTSEENWSQMFEGWQPWV